MRRLLIVGGFVVIGLGVAIGSFAGADSDADGIPDAFDNCVFVPNGPLASVGLCDSQEDGDLDGYGNACDMDGDQDGAAGLDLANMLDNVVMLSTNNTFDIDCDGAVGLADLARQLDNSAILQVPGPGLPCGNLNGTPCF